MPPSSIRDVSKKDSSKLPHAKRIKFLFSAANRMVAVSPAYASYLGRRCLKEIESATRNHGMSNAQIARLCRRCGCPVSQEAGHVEKLSASTVRRSQRQHAKTGSAVMRAGIIKTCPLCQNKITYKFPTVAIAESKLSKCIKS
eukprot:jgi/Picre1/35652/NNA_003113.t1